MQASAKPSKVPPPPQVIFGIVGGILAGVALGCTKIFDTKIKRLVGTYGSCEWLEGLPGALVSLLANWGSPRQRSLHAWRLAHRPLPMRTGSLIQGAAVHAQR